MEAAPAGADSEVAAALEAAASVEVITVATDTDLTALTDLGDREDLGALEAGTDPTDTEWVAVALEDCLE